MTRAPKLLAESESDSTSINRLYDDWAVNYDDDLIAWGYDAPAISVQYLAGLASKDQPVLDVGCGTGLVGKELQAAGFDNIYGIDFSESALHLARRTQVYSTVSRVDLTERPLPLPDAAFGALVCTGVMAYLTDIRGVCIEFCRVVEAGSPLVLTQRDDLFESRAVQQAFDEVSAQGHWKQVEVSESQDYLPGNPEFDNIGVRYCVFQRC